MRIPNLLRYLLRDYLLRAVEDGQAGPDDADDEDGDDGQDGGGEGGVGAGDDDPDAEGDDDQAEGEEGDDDTVTVSLGDDASEAEQDEERKAAPEWVRNLRKEKRELTRTLRQKDEEIARLKGSAAQPAAVVVGEEPDPDDYQMWEAEGKAKFKADLNAWHERKRQADDQKRAKDDAEARDRNNWQRTQDAYGTAKAALKVANFDDAEGAVEEAFNPTQRGIMLVALPPKQAALMVYALGNNPKKLAELSAITDPVKFTFAVAKLEAQLKVTKSKAAPPPERVPRGSIAAGGAVDNQLERLRKEARQSGDYSKVADLQRQQRQKQQKRA